MVHATKRTRVASDVARRTDRNIKMISKVKNLALGATAVCLAVYGFTGIAAGNAGTEVGGESSFGTDASASAETLAACSWFVSGVDGAVSLTNDDDMEYVGNDYELTGANSTPVSIFFSGSESPDQRCSFYDDVKGVSVNVTWSGMAFTAAGSDASLDFEAGDDLEDPASNDDGVSSFNITYTKGSCSDDWTAGASQKIKPGTTSPVEPASIADADVNTYTPTTKGGGATFASCALNAAYSTWLPGGKTPLAPGSAYSFTGPTLTTQVVIND